MAQCEWILERCCAHEPLDTIETDDAKERSTDRLGRCALMAIPKAITTSLFAAELLICLGSTISFALFGLIAVVSHVIVVLRFGTETPANQIPVYLSLAGCLAGLSAVAVTIRCLRHGRPGRLSTWLVTLGFCFGILAVMLVPNGRPPDQRVAHFSAQLEIFSTVLPLIGFGHIAYLFWRVVRSSP